MWWVKKQFEENDNFVNHYIYKIEFINNYLNNDESSSLLRYFLSNKSKTLVNKKDIKIYNAYTNYYDKVYESFGDLTAIEIFDEYFEFGIYYKFYMNNEFIEYGLKNELIILENQFGTYISLLIDMLKNFSHIDNEYKIVFDDLNGFKKALSILEMYIIKRTFCSSPSKVITRYIPTVPFDIQNLSNLNLNYYERLYLVLILYPQIYSKERDYLEYSCPNESQFLSSFLTSSIYDINKKFCKNFLIRLGTFDNKNNIDYSNYTIEHIMPRSLDKWVANGFIDTKFNELDIIKIQLVILH